MDDLIAQDADLVAKLRDEDSYYRMQEKHWCIDAEELERQRLAAADRIAALEADKARLMGLVEDAGEALDKIINGGGITSWAYIKAEATLAKIKEATNA